MNWINQPWPWYIAGPIIGLIVPTLLLIGNKTFGISSSLRHTCAACFPSNIKFFKYEWKKEVWNLFFVGGIALGGLLTMFLIPNTGNIEVNPNLANDLTKYGITDYSGLVPSQLFNWESLFSLRGIILIVAGGFLVGFGSRYAGGCTSGHAISGIANLQWPSLVATCCFMVGGIVMANFILPLLLNL
ncbi:MAG TPA: YeeE/YedE thiosulfate transporter family protein [Bacteroidia bacterium]|nr:YeeE/YedE thiosulfate transporter family protein [Bacteroidia bacterium]